MNVGVFGGSFDPPHVGHLVLAEAARDQFCLDEVLWLPAAMPPHKSMANLSKIEHRINMVKLAIAGSAYFTLSLVDVERPGPHYTVDMLRILQTTYSTDYLYLLIGSDSVADITTWKDYTMIGSMAQVIEMYRGRDYPTTAIPDIDIAPINAPAIAISSTDIRQRVRQGKTIKYMVPDAVEAYIYNHHLYSEH